jgi:Na+/citrate or Na+/malate symporter
MTGSRFFFIAAIIVGTLLALSVLLLLFSAVKLLKALHRLERK